MPSRTALCPRATAAEGDNAVSGLLFLGALAPGEAGAALLPSGPGGQGEPGDEGGGKRPARGPRCARTERLNRAGADMLE